MRRFEHFILTRFNVRVNYAKPGAGLDQEWLTHRFKLFEQFCYPSVYGQSNQDFKWLVFFDNQTPDLFKKKVAEYSDYKNFIPIYIDGEITDQIYPAIVLKSITDETEYLITTRLDNDDAISKDFVQIIQDNFHQQEFEFINLTYGCLLNDMKLYSVKDMKNPFTSLIEKINKLTVDGFKTILCVNHKELSSMGHVIQIKTKPVWLQVVHERNVANRVRGIRQPIKSLDNSFSIKMENIPTEENPLLFWVDKVLVPLQYFIYRVRAKIEKLTR